ncbi:30S ribosomal protein S4e [Candidatus Hodarchaeum mangrovi]
MGSKGTSRHRKRLSAAITYPIERKHGTFTISPHPSRTKSEIAIPLGIALREMLGYAKTLSEVKKILTKDYIKVDGIIRSSYKFALGPMDILEITKTGELYRITPYRGKRRLYLNPISKAESNLKLLQIHKKTIVKGNLIQLVFHDGRNLLLNPENDNKIPINDLSPKDSVLFNLETKEIEAHFPFAENNIGLIIGGHNLGLYGKIHEIETQIGRKVRTVMLETDEGEIKTTDNHIFIIGKEKAVIEIPQIVEKDDQNEP